MMRMASVPYSQEFTTVKPFVNYGMAQELIVTLALIRMRREV